MEQENINVSLTFARSNMYNINVETQVFMFSLGNSYPECHWFESDRRYQSKSCSLQELHDFFLYKAFKNLSDFSFPAPNIPAFSG